MFKFINHTAIASLFLGAVSGCLEPYQPPVVATDIDILVVDGFMNTTSSTATVRLTHANTLSEETQNNPEANAVVSIRSDENDVYVLIEQDPGLYSLSGLLIDPEKKYQLIIHTQDQQDYLSDLVPIQESPPIDSIVWRATSNGLDILANTHDETGKTKYYRWDYVETWEYRAPHLSAYKLVNHEAIYRDPAEYTYKCWRTLPSTNLLVGSTATLAADVIRDFQLVAIPQQSQKISAKYSILVTQRSLTEDEYSFWKDLENVTESLGGLFDAQPYQVTGNIHNASDPTAPVLGYFAGGSTAEQRIFIDFYDLPDYLQKLPRSTCILDTVCIFKDPRGNLPCSIDLRNLGGDPYLVAPQFNGPSIWAYTMASPECADCRIQGGSLNKPDFWE